MDTQNQQDTVKQMQEAIQQVSNARSPEEVQEWANRLKSYAQTLSGTRNQKTAFLIDTIAPSSNPQDLQRFTELYQQHPGVKEVSFHRDADGTPKIRIQATQEAVSRIQELLSQVGQLVSSGSSSGSYGYSSSSQSQQNR